MISIELDSCGVTEAAGSLTAEAVQTLHCLLDRCDQENVRDIVLRLPAAPSENLERVLRAVLARAFRFSAWFRAPPTASQAELFISAGHRITIAATLSLDGHELKGLLKKPAFACGAPWQVSLFLALPAPWPKLAEVLDGLESRRGTSLTLGLAWNSPETGPHAMTPVAERKWAEVLLAMAEWWTERGVSVHLACGLPLCLFSTEQLGRLALLKVRIPLALCLPNPVITLDGRARACPRLPAEGWAALPAGGGLKELGGQLIGSAGFFSGFCGRAGEQSCRSLATGACGGGCLAHNALAWQGGNGASKAPIEGAAEKSCRAQAVLRAPAPSRNVASGSARPFNLRQGATDADDI